MPDIKKGELRVTINYSRLAKIIKQTINDLNKICEELDKAALREGIKTGKSEVKT